MEVPKNKFILDACCSKRMMWSDKNEPHTIYIDNRNEPQNKVCPDIVMDFRKLEFPDKSFKLVVADPPHLKTLGETSIFRKSFGVLNAETWHLDLKYMFNECMRVLDDYGIFILKWSDNEISKNKLLKCFFLKPLFYQISSYKATSKTYWFCFMKIP